MTPTDQAIRTGFNDVSKATRGAYRYAWKVWNDYCAAVGIDPLKASVPEAQAWVASMCNRGLSPGYIQRHVSGVRVCLELLAMLGFRPYEPIRHVEVPRPIRRGPVATSTVALDDERVARAIYETRNLARAHGILWACAGMGLASKDLASMNAARIKRVGDTSVAVVSRGGRGHLVPVPRELLLVIDQVGWPVASKTSEAAKVMVGKALKPSISTTAKDLRDFHRDCAIRLGMDPAVVHACLNDGTATAPDARSRFSFSTHSAVVVSAHLRKLVLDRIGK